MGLELRISPNELDLEVEARMVSCYARRRWP